MERYWQEMQRVLGELLDLSAGERQEYLVRSALIPEVRQRVEALLRASENSAGFLEPVANPDLGRLEGARFGAWRLGPVIGSGGMGTVYRAQRNDPNFTQQAALKVIAAGRWSRFAERRFRKERQILACLEHASVARLIDGGMAPDGSQYLVMEYVDGTPIDAWCREGALGRRARLEIFRQVCEAVQFAHQHLIVHCDLKPGNILVTREGTPKLLDFGIARLVAGEPHATTTLLHPMTLDYASPEQVRGAPPGTASDIYSLGILLHELLTGRRPYELAGKPLDEVLATVCEKEIGWPGTGAADLDVIILKALEKDPSRRYGSVEQLSRDIQNYLDGRPVSAQRDSWFYRARKFATRRTVPLIAASAVLIAVLAGALATFSQKRRADRRFQEVRALAHSLLFETYDSMAATPGTLELRRQVAGRAQQYLDRLAADAAEDTALSLDLAASYMRLGQVRGSPYTANLGDTAGALEDFRQAQALLERQAALRPNDVGVQRQLVESLIGVGRLLSRQRKSPAATETLTRAAALAGAIYARRPKDPASPDALFRAMLILGETQGMAGTREGFEQQLVTYRTALDFLQVSGPRPDQFWQLSIAGAHFHISYALAGLGDTTGDAGYYRQSLESELKGDAIYRAMTAAHPNWVDDRTLADNLMTIAISRWKCCRDEAGAVRDLGEALQRFQKLAGDDPQNAELRRDLGNGYHAIGSILAETGRRAEALEADRNALRIFEALGEADPTSGENASAMNKVRNQIMALEEAARHVEQGLRNRRVGEPAGTLAVGHRGEPHLGYPSCCARIQHNRPVRIRGWLRCVPPSARISVRVLNSIPGTPRLVDP